MSAGLLQFSAIVTLLDLSWWIFNIIYMYFLYLHLPLSCHNQQYSLYRMNWASSVGVEGRKERFHVNNDHHNKKKQRQIITLESLTLVSGSDFGVSFTPSGEEKQVIYMTEATQQHNKCQKVNSWGKELSSSPHRCSSRVLPCFSETRAESKTLVRVFQASHTVQEIYHQLIQ